MYNIDFLKQLEASRRYLFESMDSRNLPSSVNYFPPQGVRVLECVEDTNGEWVPKKGLETLVSNTMK